MKISKAKLLQVISNVETRQKNSLAEWEEGWKRYQDEYESEWFRTAAPQWNTFLEYLGQALLEQRVITKAQVMQHFPNRSSEPEYYAKPTSPHAGFTLADGTTFGRKPMLDNRFEPLRKFLDTVEDEAISSSALAEMGFRNIDWLFS